NCEFLVPPTLPTEWHKAFVKVDTEGAGAAASNGRRVEDHIAIRVHSRDKRGIDAVLVVSEPGATRRPVGDVAAHATHHLRGANHDDPNGSEQVWSAAERARRRDDRRQRRIGDDQPDEQNRHNHGESHGNLPGTIEAPHYACFRAAVQWLIQRILGMTRYTVK